MRLLFNLRTSIPFALAVFGNGLLLHQRAEAFQGCCWGSKPAAPYPVGAPYPVAPGTPSYGAASGAYSAGRPYIPVTPITPSNGAMTSYYGNQGMLPPTTGTFLPNGVPQSVVSAMPTAAYDTQWQRTPVTYYRPVTQFDPNYGTTVTSLQPCTSYQYQAQRVPLVAPTPIGGAYAQQSNQWPAINQPGYYPTGVTSAYQTPMAPIPAASPMGTALAGATTPVYPIIQSLPTNGVPYQPGSVAVPASGTAIPGATGAASGLSTAVYYGNPSASSMATNNCPNGLCPPNIPGATSVTPIGPVTYLPAQPNTTALSPTTPAGTSSFSPVLPPSSSASSGSAPSGATLDPDALRAPTLPPSTPVLPNSGTPNTTAPGAQTNPQSSMPPSSTSGKPSFSSAGLWSEGDERVAKMVPMNRLPLVPVDRQPPASQAPQYPTSRSVSNPFPGAGANPRGLLPPPPPSLLPSNLEAKPLTAPEGYDAKPNWNPKLLPSAAGENSTEKVAQRDSSSTLASFQQRQ